MLPRGFVFVFVTQAPARLLVLTCIIETCDFLGRTVGERVVFARERYFHMGDQRFAAESLLYSSGNSGLREGLVGRPRCIGRRRDAAGAPRSKRPTLRARQAVRARGRSKGATLRALPLSPARRRSKGATLRARKAARGRSWSRAPTLRASHIQPPFIPASLYSYLAYFYWTIHLLEKLQSMRHSWSPKQPQSRPT